MNESSVVIKAGILNCQRASNPGETNASIRATCYQHANACYQRDRLESKDSKQWCASKEASLSPFILSADLVS